MNVGSAAKDAVEDCFRFAFPFFSFSIFGVKILKASDIAKRRRGIGCHICAVLSCNLHLIYCELWMRWIHNKLCMLCGDIEAWLRRYIARKLTCYSYKNMWYYYKFTDGVEQTKSDIVVSTPLAQNKFFEFIFLMNSSWIGSARRMKKKESDERRNTKTFSFLLSSKKFSFLLDFYIRRVGKCASTVCPGVAQVASPTDFSFAPPYFLSQTLTILSNL